MGLAPASYSKAFVVELGKVTIENKRSRIREIKYSMSMLHQKAFLECLPKVYSFKIVINFARDYFDDKLVTSSLAVQN